MNDETDETGETLTASDFDIDAECSREAFFRTIWNSLTSEEKEKVRGAR